MVKIISMSLPEQVLTQIDKLNSEMNFSGRSETIRAGIRLLDQENKERSKLKGEIRATLSIIHYHKKDLGLVMHRYQDIVLTHVHNHLDKENCLDVFVLKGEARRILKLVESFESDKAIKNVKLFIV